MAIPLEKAILYVLICMHVIVVKVYAINQQDQLEAIEDFKGSTLIRLPLGGDIFVKL